MTQAQHCAYALWVIDHAPPVTEEDRTLHKTLIAAELARREARQEATRDLFQGV